PDLFPRLDARPVGHSLEGRHPPRGGTDSGSGRVYPGNRGGPRGGWPVAAEALTRVRRAFVARLSGVLRLDDPPWRVALALAGGLTYIAALVLLRRRKASRMRHV